MESKQIISRQQYDALKEAERRLGVALDLIERGEACGIECAGYRGVHDSLRRQIQAFEQQFASPPPK